MVGSGIAVWLGRGSRAGGSELIQRWQVSGHDGPAKKLADIAVTDADDVGVGALDDDGADLSAFRASLDRREERVKPTDIHPALSEVPSAPRVET